MIGSMWKNYTLSRDQLTRVGVKKEFLTYMHANKHDRITNNYTTANTRHVTFISLPQSGSGAGSIGIH